MHTLEIDGITFMQSLTTGDMADPDNQAVAERFLAAQALTATTLWREVWADIFSDPASAWNGFLGSPNEGVAAMIASRNKQIIGGIAFDFTATSPQVRGDIQIEHIHVTSPHRGNGHLARLLTAFAQINCGTEIDVRAPITPVVLSAMEKYAPGFVALEEKRDPEEVADLLAQSRAELRKASTELARRCRSAHRGPRRGATKDVPCRSCALEGANRVALSSVAATYETRMTGRRG